MAGAFLKIARFINSDLLLKIVLIYLSPASDGKSNFGARCIKVVKADWYQKMISNLESNISDKQTTGKLNRAKSKIVKSKPPIECESQLTPIQNKTMVANCGGLKITVNVEDNQSHYPCESPDFNSLRIDPARKIKGRSVPADMIRLFAAPGFWKAALTGNQKAVDDQARKLVPVVPCWEKSTWGRVAKMNPEQQYAVAIWISDNCFRQPQLRAIERIDSLQVLIEAWVMFDKNSRWIDPSLAHAPHLQDFVRTVDKFINSPESQMLTEDLSKRIPRKGAPNTLTRTKQIIEASALWVKRGQPSLSDLDRILVEELGWNHKWFKANNTKKTDSFIKLARESIKLAQALRTV